MKKFNFFNTQFNFGDLALAEQWKKVFMQKK